MTLQLLNNDFVEVPPALASWLEKCPDLATLQQLLQRQQWFETIVMCHLCDRDFPRHTLQWYEYGPFADYSEVICRGCWENLHTVFVMSKDTIRPWPTTTIKFREPGDIQFCSGVLRCKSSRKVVGTVTEYNGTIGKVHLFAYPAAAEIGTVSDEYDVELDDLNDLKKQQSPKSSDTVVPCSGCGHSFPRRVMLWYDDTPYARFTDALCKDCWEHLDSCHTMMKSPTKTIKQTLNGDSEVQK
jgi:hypothetical protein